MAGSVRLDIYNTVNLGAYCFTNDNFTLLPFDISLKDSETITDTLETKAFRTTIAGSPLIGILITGNNNGVLVPHIITDNELNFLEEVFGRVEILKSKMTALGNVILANDYAALVHPELETDALKIIKKVLGVEVRRGKIAGYPTVGSVAVVTNKGLLAHPDASDDELKFLSEFFSVEADAGTVNKGSGYIKLGVLVNTRGAVVGGDTTGFEIARIEQVFKIIRGGHFEGRG